MKAFEQGPVSPPPNGGLQVECGAGAPSIWIEVLADQQRWLLPLSDIDERPLVVGTGSRSDVRLGGRPVGFFHLEKRGDDAVLAPGYGGPLLLDSLPVVRAIAIRGRVVVQLGDLRVQVEVHGAKPDSLGHLLTSNSHSLPRGTAQDEVVTSVHAYEHLPTAAFRAVDEAETVVRSITFDETETLALPVQPEFLRSDANDEFQGLAPVPPVESAGAQVSAEDVLSTEILGSLPDIFGSDEAQDLGAAPVLDPACCGHRLDRSAADLAEIALRPSLSIRTKAPRLRLRSVRLERVLHPELPDGGSGQNDKVAACFLRRGPFRRLARMVRERPGFVLSLLLAALFGLGVGYVPQKGVLGVGHAGEKKTPSTSTQEPDSAHQEQRLPSVPVNVHDQSGDSAVALAAADEKRAVEHLFAGRREEALALYARLSLARPDREEFLTITSLLERYLAPPVSGQDPAHRPLFLP